MNRNLCFLFTWTLVMTGCNAFTSTPTAASVADSYFSGYAFVDANGNGQLDPADTPLKDAIFIVQLEGGAQFGGRTDESGTAFVTIPAAVQYPVTLLMKPPVNSSWTLIGPARIILQEPAREKTSFLFAAK
ncbi:MAG: hypothetical protein K8S20_01815 [Chloroflexi bacterium]|nr:hypothetical protein [Chloroflexota bacterium]